MINTSSRDIAYVSTTEALSILSFVSNFWGAVQFGDSLLIGGSIYFTDYI